MCQYNVRYLIKGSGAVGDAVVILHENDKDYFKSMKKYIAHIESIVGDKKVKKLP